MSIGSFETENQNTLQQNQQYFLDFDGSLKFTTPYISSPNFNGDIPTIFDTTSASLVVPGMYLSLSGAAGDAYYLVTSRSFDDPDFTNASRDYTIRYLDTYGVTQEVVYDADDSVYVKYEDWNEKDLGTVGWAITSGGNAIFTNVAVRGRIEAEEGYISGSLTIGSGGSTTLNDVATTDDLDGYIPDGQAAADIITNATTITGGNISTGQIQSSGYSGGNVFGTSFSTSGAAFNLDYGTITAPNFRIDSSGNAFFKGSVTAKSFQTEIGVNNNYIIIEDDVFSKSDKITFIASTTIPGGSTRILGLNAAEPNIQVEYKDFGGYTLKSLILTGWKAPGISTGPPILSLNTENNGSRSIALLSENVYMTNANVYGNFIGDGSQLTNINASNLGSGTVPSARLSGTYGISITGNAATATLAGYASSAGTATSATSAGTATTAIYANNLDSNQSGGARITGNNVLVTSVGTSTSSDLIRRDGSNTLKVTSSSSKKIKTNISLLENVNILDIDVVQFKYIDGYLDEKDQRFNKLMPGFIAEQVYETLPEAVDLDENGEPKNWNDRILIPIIVKTIQDQQKIIEDLQDRVLQLESQIGG